jgi:hypothetical protein
MKENWGTGPVFVSLWEEVMFWLISLIVITKEIHKKISTCLDKRFCEKGHFVACVKKKNIS